MNFGYKFRVKDSGAQSPSHPLFPLSSPSSPPPPSIPSAPPLPSPPPLPLSPCPLGPSLTFHFSHHLQHSSGRRLLPSPSLPALLCLSVSRVYRDILLDSRRRRSEEVGGGGRGSLAEEGLRKGLKNYAEMCLTRSARELQPPRQHEAATRGRDGGRSQQTRGNDEQRHRHDNEDFLRIKGGRFEPGSGGGASPSPPSLQHGSPSRGTWEDNDFFSP